MNKVKKNFNNDKQADQLSATVVNKKLTDILVNDFVCIRQFMKHIDWLKSSNINLIKVNLRYDTLLCDIDLYQTRLISLNGEYFIRYKKGRKIFWYKSYLHKTSNGFYYLTLEIINDEKIRNKLNRKYIVFNRDYILSSLFNKQ